MNSAELSVPQDNLTYNIRYYHDSLKKWRGTL
jgi:hypothetical protein